MVTAEDIKKARAERGVTQRELAAALGVERNYIYLLEAGKRQLSERLETLYEAWKKATEAPTNANCVAERPFEDPPVWADALADRLDRLERDIGIIKTALLQLSVAILKRNPLEPEE